MITINPKLTDGFGYHLPSTLEKLGGSMKSEVKEMNILNGAGYLPVVAGAYRINQYARPLMKKGPDNQLTKTEKLFFAVQIARGVIEFLGGGLLFLIPDIILTLGRAYGKWEMDIKDGSKAATTPDPDANPDQVRVLSPICSDTRSLVARSASFVKVRL